MDDKPVTKERDELLTIGTVASMYGVSEETVRRWMRKGAIRYVAVGPHNARRVPKSEADRMLRPST